MIDAVKRLIAGPSATTLFECRHCGTEVDPERDSCPRCGSTEIAAYRLS